jgi:two-component system cell cycle sensor histidine kinase/response regulator CckA
MTDKGSQTEDAAPRKGSRDQDGKTLRKEAEEVARERAAQWPEQIDAMSPGEARQIVHELQVHQIELEMQNEELRRIQVELDASRSRYFDLYDLAPVGYCTVSDRGLILEANLTAATMLGTARSTLVMQRISTFIVPEDQNIYYQCRKELLETGKPQACELRIAKKDGTVFWAHLETTAVEDGDGAFVNRLVFNDVSERKQAEEERRKLEERMNQVQKLEALGGLVAGVAHNINNVLTVIMGAASLHERDATQTKDQEEDYKTIITACKRGRDVIKSLIQFAQPSLPSETALELHALITEVRVLLESTTLNRIKIVESFCGRPLWIQGNAASLNHALINLCLNGLDAMPEGGTITLRTAIPEQDWAEVSVEDTGEGMAPEILARSMEPFFTTKPLGQGTGLGLSMTYGVIKSHRGTLEISSLPGKGTVVKLRLPLWIPPPVQEKTIMRATSSLCPMNILLVDDDEDVLLLVARMFRKAGDFQVKPVKGGEEALESLRSGPLPDLIILDQNMPRMNGVETMEKIRVLHPGIPILISSGQPNIEECACFQQPKVAVISKPFDMEEINAKLAQFALASTPLPPGTGTTGTS